MIKTVRDAWQIPELRRKILFTIFALLIFRLGAAIPVPYINTAGLETYLSAQSGTILGLMNAMSGSAFSMATLFALSIQPYINSSIIIQLLTVAMAIPALERLAKEGGEEGRKKIASITRYTTVAIGLIQGFGYYSLINSYGLVETEGLPGVWVAIVIILSFTAGSAFLMWLGEQITEFGIGNGISVLLFAGIVSRFPHMLRDMISGIQAYLNPRTEEQLAAMTEVERAAYENSILAPWMIAVIVVGMLALVVLIVFISNSERRLPVQYAKRVVGRKMYGGQSTHIPIKVNMGGVMPIIFAQSIAMIPATIGALRHSDDAVRYGESFLQRAVFPAHRGLQLLLCHHAVQPRGGGQQPEEERRLHPRLPSGQAHCRLHHVRSPLPVHRGHRAHHHRQPVRVQLPGHRRHLRDHRGGRRPGDHQADGGPDAHAALQGLPGVMGREALWV